MNGLHEKRKPKVLMIGIDGATLDLIKPWAKEGKLPTFKRLLDEGGHGELESVIPPVTPPAWTSLMTGMNPGKHGLFNFIDHDLADYSIRYANAGSRRVPTVWKRLSDLGWRVGVINMPMTYPPEPLNGFCISGLDTPDESSPFVYPPELKLEIERSVGKIYLDPRHLGYMTTDEKRDSVLADLVKIENRRTEIAEYLMAHHPVDVLALVYTATDTVQHFFWHYMDPAHPFYDPRGAERYRDAVLDIYRAIDSNIARLLSSVSDETAVLVVSDHGGGPVSSPVISLNRFLEEEGWLVYKKGGGANPGRLFHRVASSMDDYLKGILTPGQKAWLAKGFPFLREKWESYATSAAMIDWEKTWAYCLEFLSFPSEIWINLKGRTPAGQIEPGVGYERAIELLTGRLYDLKDDRTGRRLIRRVYRKEEIYHGPYLDRAPDLILSWWEADAFRVQKSVPGERGASVQSGVGSEGAESASKSASWSGTHRLEGVLLLHGKIFRNGLLLPKSHITDIAPTLLYLLGVPVSSEMDGRVLSDAFQPEFTAARPVEYDEGGLPVHAGPDSGGASYTDSESEKIRERLKGLGYID